MLNDVGEESNGSDVMFTGVERLSVFTDIERFSDWLKETPFSLTDEGGISAEVNWPNLNIATITK